MSSRKSDTSAPSASADDAPLAASTTAPVWRQSLIASLGANLPIPVVLLLLIPLSRIVEGHAFGLYNQRIVMLIGFNIILAVSLQLINGFSGQFSLGHAGFMAVGAYLAAYPAISYSQRLTDPTSCLLFFISLGIVLAIGGVILLGLFLLIR